MTGVSGWPAAARKVAAWRAIAAESVEIWGVAAQLRLSPRFIEVITRGPTHLESLRAAEIRSRRADLDLHGLSARLVDVAFSIASKAKLFLCPFSGEWRETRKTVGSEAFLGEYQDRTCLILQFCVAYSASADSAYAFPEQGIVLFFGALIPPAGVLGRLADLFDAISKHRGLLEAHLAAEDAARPLAVAEMRVPHFGHFVWNGLSAWGHLLPRFASDIEIFLSWRESNYTGSVLDLYPEVGGSEFFLLSDESELVKTVYERKLFSVFAKDHFITEDVGRRVVAHAWRACPKQPRDELVGLRENCRVVVLLALRTGNRSWIGQEAGLVELARALATKLRSVGFVIDGMNGNTSRGWTHGLMSLAGEVDLASRLTSRIGAFSPCRSSVGASMAESLVASDICDVFVAPAGSGLAKYKWIANKPGVLIANSVVLDKRDPRGEPVRVFEHSRENLLASKFVPSDAVVDIEAANRPGASHADFELDWRVVLAELEALLGELGIAAG